MRVCLVGFRDDHGVLHAAEVQAASLFEAAVRGLAVIRDHPSLAAAVNRTTVLEVVTVPGTRIGRVRVDRLLQWLDGTARSPREQVQRYQLKQLLVGAPRGRINRRERYH